eukprot:CAMPEP_0178814400 /NCGR_PEP_ID=MMETSP0746-20121128/273_1 /TAXON_ID=913974 /ORGANISM="Nitzschia punctata, Strain CCMP561" /LENGTH=152 /DNA_ID=CAMNT_0020475305 /DNA_START=544 /DNA_END=1002 /DNA_ORIENTATION=-
MNLENLVLAKICRLGANMAVTWSLQLMRVMKSAWLDFDEPISPLSKEEAPETSFMSSWRISTNMILQEVAIGASLASLVAFVIVLLFLLHRKQSVAYEGASEHKREPVVLSGNNANETTEDGSSIADPSSAQAIRIAESRGIAFEMFSYLPT